MTGGVHRVDGVNGNVYLIVSEPDSATLVDTGMPRSESKIQRILSGVMGDGAVVKQIVLTHCHVDHAGSAKALKQTLAAKVYVGEKDAPYVAGEEKLYPKGVMGAAFRLFEPAVRFSPFQPDGTLSGGEKVGSLRVIPVPGHTPGSICLYDEDTKTLFSGDALLSSGGQLKLPNRSFSYDYQLALNSLSKLLEMGLQIENLCPGHGDPVLGDVGHNLRELMENG
ncbi:MAG: MBL fold metallo-hydrolase [Thermoprotei archaeon]